jgi:poly-beta-1,6-N-acetyl-D-glucosamine biosynthesis protein PgaD
VNKPKPLIINQPGLQSPLRRGFAFLLTLAAWVIWMLLLMPMLWIAAARFGLHLPHLDYFSRIDSERMAQILDFLPLALLLILSALSLLLVNGLYAKLRRATRKAPALSPDMHRAVLDVKVDQVQFAMWQSARIVQVDHSSRGRVKDVHVIMTADGKRALK